MASPLPSTYVEGFHDLASVQRTVYNTFGDRRVSALSLGASSLAGVFRDSVTLAESCKVVEFAVRSGINLIDTAPWYGHGRSEEVLGEALAGIPRSAYYLHTKVGRYEPDVLETFDFSYERTLRSVDESLKRMRVDYIDTVQVHDPEFAPSLDIIVNETLPALEECRKAGKIRYIGITGFPLAMLRELATRATVPVHTCISYGRYNLHDRALLETGTLDFLKSKGIAVISASPLSMGLLTQRGPPAWHPATPGLKAACAAAAAWCKERGVDISHLALSFCLEQPAIATTMISTASLARLQHDIAVAQGLHPLTKEERSIMEECIAKFFAGPGYEAIQSWEGREVQDYWAALGRATINRWYARKAEARAAGGAEAAARVAL